MIDTNKFDTRTAPGHQTAEQQPVIQSPSDLIPGYRMLSGDEQALVKAVKARGEEIAFLCAEALTQGADPRAVATAKTQFQGAFMWLTRSITKPTTFA